MKPVVSVLFVAGAFILGAREVCAQHEPSFIIMPRAGVIAQARPFTQNFLLVPDYTRKWRYKMDPSVTYGALIEVPTPYRSVGVRLEMSSASRENVTKSGGEGPPLQDEVTAQIDIASAAMIYQPARLCWGGVCPRLLGGGGIKRYDFEGNLLWDDIVDRFAEDQSHFTLQLGAGIVAYASRLAIIAEIVDYSNGIRFASRDQPTNRAHDLAFSLGAGVRF
jgi:hypothetical protein